MIKILIATGGSEYSFMAVKKACEMVSSPDNYEIRIVSVYEDLAASSAEPLGIDSEEIDKIQNIGRLQATDYALAAAEIIRRHFPKADIPISMKALKGSPKAVILAEASAWNADVIVVGSLGHNFLSRMFIGSVSESIVKHAKCSVVVVRGNPADGAPEQN
ncbi:MAG: universal stress protein [Acidobacteriota bacterium]|nr:universal stress protein [Acidobacteriota bacterium]MDH3529846.1 universal stress protein [Acidobacteriota bacterium]